MTDETTQTQTPVAPTPAPTPAPVQPVAAPVAPNTPTDATASATDQSSGAGTTVVPPVTASTEPADSAPAAPSAPAPVAPVVTATPTPAPAEPAPVQPVVTPAPVAPAPAEPVAPAPAPVAPVAPATATPTAPVAPTSSYFSRLEYMLEQYVTNMAPGKTQTPQSGAANQRSLLGIYTHVLSADAADVKQAFDLLLGKIQQYRSTVFSETMVYRFFDKLNLGQQESKLFEQLTHLFINTANPASRAAALQQISLNQVAKNLSVPKHLTNLSTYYSSNPTNP